MNAARAARNDALARFLGGGQLRQLALDCECDDPACRELVTVTLRELGELRAAGRPLIAHRHDRAA